MRRTGRRAAAAALVLALSGCAATDGAPVARGAGPPATLLPPMRTFPAAAPRRTARSNAGIARDILALSFELESGTALPVLARFEGPVTVRAIDRDGGTALPPTLLDDLDALLARMRAEAGLDIARTDAASAGITI